MSYIYIHAKFREGWFWHSEADWGRGHKAYFYFFKNEKSRLKLVTPLDASNQSLLLTLGLYVDISHR
jgi:hypothetical protein